MIKLLKYIGYLLIAALLTLFTQIGGAIYLLLLPITAFLTRTITNRAQKRLLGLSIHVVSYLLIILFVLPPIAKRFGRVPLPISTHAGIKPLNTFTWLCNRHYVRPQLLETLKTVSQQLRKQYPSTVIAYMDANFPFKKGYPLWPHLSHNDGKKIDIAFLYKAPTTGQPLHRIAKSWMGYGGCETPRQGEYNTAKLCANQGFWQYNLLQKLHPQWLNKNIEVDVPRTRQMVQLFAYQPQVNVMYLEPYLKARWGVNHGKIGFHGCQSVRHDDHLHVSIY
jgi:hypothetical protein